jgi:hypothetical protein
MAGKWRYVGGALVVALGVAIMPLEAQMGMGGRGRGPEGPGEPGGPNMGSSIALALEHQSDLGLTKDQVSQLQELQAVIDGNVKGLAEEMSALRERIRSGQVPREDGLRQIQALRGELMTASAPLRGRVQEILTVDQHQKLQPLVRENRPGLGRVMGQRGGGRAVLPGRGGRGGMVGQGGRMRGAIGPQGRFNAPALGPRQARPMARANRGIGAVPGAPRWWGRGGSTEPGA